ncbi:TLR4-like protein [Mya arenaria]|uniref:TLR4-like protein n=1 Tax=Mya arenaria TaxID=6604 RepID=A0ABY7EKN3_MYAAR|nr:toll-like receptor 4 [Mya arenaria]WAR10552.1 TLR4-like protein [Mya arenaria]
MGQDNYLFVIAFLIVHANISMSFFTCGPDLKCSCTTRPSGAIAMDCKARNVKLRQVCENIAQIYPNVSDLNIARNNIGSINAKDMNHCRNISSLNMNYNQISSLRSGVLKDFRNILTLDLSENVLDIFNNTAFDPSVLPSSLRILKLYGNFREDSKLERSFAYPNFTKLRNLAMLQMDGIETDFGLEYENSSVKNLTLSSQGPLGFCSIKEIFPTTFHSLANIRVLDISSCRIENIYRDAFKHMKCLEILDLSLNRRLGFSSLKNITYSLQFTNIQFVNYSRVYTSFGVGTIILNRDICYLRNTSLKAVAFDGNNIEMIEKNTNLLLPKHLETIYGQENTFTFGLYLFQFGCLENVLHIHANNQNKMHSPIKYFAEPTSKNDNDRNRDSECPFMTEESLKSIAKDIHDCTYFPAKETVAEMKPQFSRSLKSIYFSGCNLVYSIDNTDINISPSNNTIEVLDFSKNAFHSLSGRIGPFPNLKFLSLSRSYCSFISSEILSMVKLENLQLDQNYLGEMFAHQGRGDTFEYLTHLKTLNLSTNRITRLHKNIFSRLKNVENIDLSSKNIEMFDVHVTSLKNLLHLNLQGNTVHKLNHKTRQLLEDNSMRIGKNFTLDLRNNSIEYSCSNQQFLYWLLDHKERLQGFHEMVFYRLNGSSVDSTAFLREVPHLRAQCRSYTVAIVLSALGVLSACAIIIAVILYKKRWKLRYWYYMTKQNYFGYRRLVNDYKDDDYRYDAFISYSDHDLHFIRDEIIPRLENRGMKLCVHQRDFLPGIPITDNIVDAIRTSNKTVVILSKTFVKKQWCIFEFNMARMESIDKRLCENGCLVIVLYENVPAKEIPLEVMDWIDNHSYIRYTRDPDGQPLFWESLTTAIEH